MLRKVGEGAEGAASRLVPVLLPVSSRRGVCVCVVRETLAAAAVGEGVLGLLEAMSKLLFCVGRAEPTGGGVGLAIAGSTSSPVDRDRRPARPWRRLASSPPRRGYAGRTPVARADDQAFSSPRTQPHVARAVDHRRSWGRTAIKQTGSFSKLSAA
jgi:hypothetical protein